MGKNDESEERPTTRKIARVIRVFRTQLAWGRAIYAIPEDVLARYEVEVKAPYTLRDAIGLAIVEFRKEVDR